MTKNAPFKERFFVWAKALLILMASVHDEDHTLLAQILLN